MKSRKLIVFSVCFVVGIALALANKLTTESSNFIIMMAGVYTTGNIGTKISSAISNRIANNDK